MKTILGMLNDLYELCLRIDDEEEVIVYITIALWDIIHKVERKVPQSLACYFMNWLPHMNNSAISFRTILARIYDIREECRHLNDSDDITEDIMVLIHQVKTYHLKSTFYLLGQRSRVIS